MTGLPTKIGRSFMKRLYVQYLILSGTVVLSLGACVHKPTTTMKAVTSLVTPSPPPQLVLLQEARSEAENMRAELASLKILMAKQAGELRSLREQTQSVQHREQDQGRQLQNIRSQLLSSQTERDQLRKHNMELEGQVASMPDTSQLVLDIQALHGTFQQMLGSLKGVASDITLIKQEMQITTNILKPQQTKLTKTRPTVAFTDKQTPDTQGRIIIQYGDTLWEFSRTYGVSVEQLKKWNHMTSDFIMTGFHLKVVEPMEGIEDQPDHVKTSTELPIPTVINESLDAPIQMTSRPSEETQVGIPTEPTHILSISPQPDSHESP